MMRSGLMLFSRYLTFILLIIGVSVSLPVQAETIAEKQASGFVRSISTQTLAILNSKVSDESKQKKLETVFLKVVDVDWIGKFVLSRYWREAKPEERARYKALYRRYLVNSYVPKFRSYTDQKIEFKNTLTEDKNEYLVETEIVSAKGDAAPINVAYRVRAQGDGSFRVFDVVAEGVSLLTTQRSEFSAILSRDGLTVLTDKLEEKVKMAEAEMATKKQ